MERGAPTSPFFTSVGVVDGERMFAFSPDDAWLAVFDRDYTLRVYEAASGREALAHRAYPALWQLAWVGGDALCLVGVQPASRERQPESCVLDLHPSRVKGPCALDGVVDACWWGDDDRLLALTLDTAPGATHVLRVCPSWNAMGRACVAPPGGLSGRCRLARSAGGRHAVLTWDGGDPGRLRVAWAPFARLAGHRSG